MLRYDAVGDLVSNPATKQESNNRNGPKNRHAMEQFFKCVTDCLPTLTAVAIASAIVSAASVLGSKFLSAWFNDYFAKKRDDRNRSQNERIAQRARIDAARSDFLAVLNPIIRDMGECRSNPDERWKRSKASLKPVYDRLRLELTGEQLDVFDSAFHRYCNIPAEEREPEIIPPQPPTIPGRRYDYSKVTARMLEPLREMERIVAEF